MKLAICQKCKKEVRRKYLGKIRGVDLCKDCKSIARKERREETIDKAGIREDLKKLDTKIMKEYRKTQSNNRRMSKPISIPRPKGSTYKKPRDNNYCYLTLEERQSLFKILLKRGLNKEEAGDRIKTLQESQAELRSTLKIQKKSDDEIKQRQQELLEELWCS